MVRSLCVYAGVLKLLGPALGSLAIALAGRKPRHVCQPELLQLDYLEVLSLLHFPYSIRLNALSHNSYVAWLFNVLLCDWRLPLGCEVKIHAGPCFVDEEYSITRELVAVGETPKVRVKTSIDHFIPTNAYFLDPNAMIYSQFRSSFWYCLLKD